MRSRTRRRLREAEEVAAIALEALTDLYWHQPDGHDEPQRVAGRIDVQRVIDRRVSRALSDIGRVRGQEGTT